MDKSTRNEIFLEFLGDYNGVCLKNFQRIEQKLKNAFLAIFSILLRIRNFKELIIGILLHQHMPLMFLRQQIPSVDGKYSRNYSKIHVESIKFKNQCIAIVF